MKQQHFSVAMATQNSKLPRPNTFSSSLLRPSKIAPRRVVFYASFAEQAAPAVLPVGLPPETVHHPIAQPAAPTAGE